MQKKDLKTPKNFLVPLKKHLIEKPEKVKKTKYLDLLFEPTFLKDYFKK
jgi:hypothetical protein